MPEGDFLTALERSVVMSVNSGKSWAHHPAVSKIPLGSHLAHNTCYTNTHSGCVEFDQLVLIGSFAPLSEMFSVNFLRRMAKEEIIETSAPGKAHGAR